MPCEAVAAKQGGGVARDMAKESGTSAAESSGQCCFWLAG